MGLCTPLLLHEAWSEDISYAFASEALKGRKQATPGLPFNKLWGSQCYQGAVFCTNEAWDRAAFMRTWLGLGAQMRKYSPTRGPHELGGLGSQEAQTAWWERAQHLM